MRTMKKEVGMSHGALHIKSVYVHNNKIVLGEPLLVTDKM